MRREPLWPRSTDCCHTPPDQAICRACRTLYACAFEAYVASCDIGPHATGEYAVRELKRQSLAEIRAWLREHR
jgi:hypothetical protein